MKDLKDLPTVDKKTDLTKQEEFSPTPHMLVWIDTAVRLMTDNISEIERESKVTAQSWYNWIKDDNFRVWFKQEWEKRLSGDTWKLDAIGMNNAKKDHKYWETMMKVTGRLQDKINTPNTAVQINNFNGDKYLDEV